jgi:uncharacterized protein YecE (DUF72 family)
MEPASIPATIEVRPRPGNSALRNNQHNCPTVQTHGSPVSSTKAVVTHSTRKIFVGTAAWSNPPAERLRRNDGASHLEHYATQFGAVEINSSFYRSHRRATYQNWRDATPAQFRFSVKMTRTVTHDCALRNCRTELKQFLAEVSGLGQKLQVILVQTPASLAFEAAVVSRFFGALNTPKSHQIACEPRHPSWWTPRADAVLRRHGVARVATDPARAPEAASPGAAKRLIYYRLHGSPRMYYSAYSTEYLHTLAATVMTASSKAREVWCIFDNTARHASWDNARLLCRLIGGA